MAVIVRCFAIDAGLRWLLESPSRVPPLICAREFAFTQEPLTHKQLIPNLPIAAKVLAITRAQVQHAQLMLHSHQQSLAPPRY